jgi:hypothetical protein
MFRWKSVMMLSEEEERPALRPRLVRIVPIENRWVEPLLAYRRI